jgi:ATP-dependent Lhr-like helicase
VVIAGTPRWTAVEDVSRLRDALGVPLPPGLPGAFAEPVEDPLGDLVSRYARSHGPFTVEEVAARWQLGTAVVLDTLRRLGAAGRVVEGEFRPGGRGSEWCDAEVLRRLRRRSLAALRAEVEPVEPAALGRFLPAWQHVNGRLRGVGGVLAVVEQLAGCAVPASALEPLVLRARVIDYHPAMLDELTASGEVLWAGSGSLPGADGWVGLHLADTAALTLPEPAAVDELGELAGRVLEVLAGGGGYFFRQLSQAVGSTDDQQLHATLWDLVWGGHVGNDTLAPLRTLTQQGRAAHRSRRPTPRSRYATSLPGRASRPAMPSRTGPPSAAGRWSALPERDPDPTLRTSAAGRPAAATPRRGDAGRCGQRAGPRRLRRRLQGTGRVRGRGSLSARLLRRRPRRRPVRQQRRSRPAAAESNRDGANDERRSLTLAATDPANPYGAALPGRTGRRGSTPPPSDTGRGGRRGRWWYSSMARWWFTWSGAAARC